MKRRHDDSEALLSIENVAERLQLSPKSIRRLIERGELKAYKLGRQWRVSQKDFQTFLRNRWTD